MGLPELPGQSEDINFNVGENHTINVEPMSDESDNESMDENGYAGYQPLNLDEFNGPANLDEAVDEDENSDTVEIEDGAQQRLPELTADGEADREMLNVDVWNAPRPNELNIEIDPVKAEQIVNVMAGIKLPTTAVPDWARGVPEEEWKENLLQRIRQRQQTDVHGKPAHSPDAASRKT